MNEPPNKKNKKRRKSKSKNKRGSLQPSNVNTSNNLNFVSNDLANNQIKKSKTLKSKSKKVYFFY